MHSTLDIIPATAAGNQDDMTASFRGHLSGSYAVITLPDPTRQLLWLAAWL
jgi:hypothetical protein